MPINPVQFAHSVCDEFLRYIFSAFPLSDPQIESQAKELLKRSSSLDIPLVKGPYVSLSEAFAKGDPIQKLADEGRLHPVMPGLIGYPKMYLHQQEVFEAVREKHHVLVSTGTGSGKTEAFLYPIVDDLLRERDQGITSGLSAILVYPMNALANDQLDRLREMLGGTGISFGQWVGPTPDTEAKVTIDRFESSSREAYLSARQQRLNEAQREDRAVRPLAPMEECCSEEAIRNRKPRILITNYRQLEILTTRLPDVELFAGAPLKYLVFDEAHTYSGAVGAEVACLIRRLRLLAGKEPNEVTCVGTSATLADPNDPQGDNETVAKRFASRFFGVDEAEVKLVSESYVEREWPKQRYKPVFPHGDGVDRLGRILDAVTEPVKHEVVKSVIEELTGQIFEPGDDWRQSLFDHLLGNEYVYQSTQILKHPKPLSEAAWQTSQRVAMGRRQEGDDCSAELLCYLVLGAAARNGDESLLRPKVHFFLRGLDEMVVALQGTPEEVLPKLYLSLHDAKEGEGGGRHDDSFLPVLTCRNCGQHFFERHFQDLDFTYGSGSRIRGFENGDAVVDPKGNDNAVWATTPAETGTRLLMSNRLLEDAGDSSTGRSARWPRVYLCRHCGALHRSECSQCLAEGCGHREPLLPLLAFGPTISSCPSCNSQTLSIGGRRIEPAKPIRAVTVADVHSLSQAMINAAPDGHKKLIVFADSRQDAAFQAGWMQDHARRLRMRHMMNEVILQASEPILLDAITDGLMETFRKDQLLIEALLPELLTEEAPVFFGHNKWVPVYKSLRYMVLREFTTSVRSTRWLEALGLVRILYSGLTPQHEKVRQWAKKVGLTPDEAVDLISLFLDGWRRNRMVFIADDPVYSQYHRKDDPYIQLGLLALKDLHPVGVDKYKANNRYATGLISDQGTTAVQSLMKRIVPDPENTDVDTLIEELWDLLKDDLGLIRKVGIQNTRGHVIGEVWQVVHDRILVEPFGQRERCTTCHRITTRKCPTSACVRYRCPGSTNTEPADPENYDVWLLGKPFTMVSAEEHTAQVPGDTRSFIEQDFKSKQGRTNCLVATPTLEMGVNIGVLDMTLMRNVPPLASNYWQRAGRAGREERMAVIVTYCRRSLHDRYFFADPLRILDGVIEAPSFNLKNPLMVAKHVRSAVLSILLLRSRQDGEISERIRLVLKHLFPHFIRDYLLDNDNRFRNVPISTNSLKTLLAEMPEFPAEVVDLFAKNWPGEAEELATEESVRQITREMASDLTVVLTRLHNRLTWARNTRKELHRKKDQGIIEREEEQLLWRCDDYIRSIVKRDASTYTLSVLGVEGFFPGYGVNDGGVIASARRGFARGVGRRAFDLNRSSVIALREFVPGNRLYANNGSFYVSRYHLGTDESSHVRTLYVNAEKRYVAEKNADTSYGQTGSEEIDTLPITDSDLSLASRITEEEMLRFSMPVCVVGRMRRVNKGGKGVRIGDREVSYLRGQGIELVNLGEAGRIARGEQPGHWICSICGATKSPYVVDSELSHFLKTHEETCGKEPTRLALTVKAEVDCLHFHKIPHDADAINIGEALVAGAVRVLDMGTSDLESLVIHRPDETVDLLIFDPMPGGSGLLDQMLERWAEIIRATKELLAECPQGCETACYSCLLSFRNQFNHGLLNRHKALELVSELQFQPETYRTIEELHEESSGGSGDSPTNNPEARLVRLLRDHHFPEGECQTEIKTPAGLTTRPDWVHESTKVAIYLDGMSRHLHGDPKAAQRDQLIRQMLELDGYKIIVVQSRDLDDPQAVRLHLRNIANAISRSDLAEMIDQTPVIETQADPMESEVIESAPAAETGDVASELLEYADERCRSFLKAWVQQGYPEPVVGFGLEDEEGIVVAEAELAWPTQKVAAVFPDQDGKEAFEEAGWRVYNATDLESAREELANQLGETP